MNKISVRQSADRLSWWVTFRCCDARRLLMHDWTLAMQVADEHVYRHRALAQVLAAGADSSPSKTAEKLEGNR